MVAVYGTDRLGAEHTAWQQNQTGQQDRYPALFKA